MTSAFYVFFRASLLTALIDKKIPFALQLCCLPQVSHTIFAAATTQPGGHNVLRMESRPTHRPSPPKRKKKKNSNAMHTGRDFPPLLRPLISPRLSEGWCCGVVACGDAMPLRHQRSLRFKNRCLELRSPEPKICTKRGGVRKSKIYEVIIRTA